MVYHEVVLLVNSSGMNMQLEALQPATYKSLHEYGNRYCIGVSSAQKISFLPWMGYPAYKRGSRFLTKACPSCFLFVGWRDIKSQGNFGVYQGSSNLQELHGLVKATVMIRRLKRDVLSQLPQKRRQQVGQFLVGSGLLSFLPRLFFSCLIFCHRHFDP